jgi:hypothetical protein
MSNRILAFLRPRECSHCSHCSQLHAIERQLDAAAIEAERIEAVAGETVEFWIPDASRVAKPKPDDEGEVGIRMILATESRIARIDEDLTAFAIEELRRIGTALLNAADLVEGGVR